MSKLQITKAEIILITKNTKDNTLVNEITKLLLHYNRHEYNYCKKE